VGEGAAGVSRVEVDPPRVDVVIRQVDQERIKAIETAPLTLGAITKATTLTPELVLPPGASFSGDRPPVVRVTVEPPPEKGEMEK
jgi:hypothetical protein